jgi:hypothetical protein
MKVKLFDKLVKTNVTRETSYRGNAKLTMHFKVSDAVGLAFQRQAFGEAICDPSWDCKKDLRLFLRMERPAQVFGGNS